MAVEDLFFLTDTIVTISPEKAAYTLLFAAGVLLGLEVLSQGSLIFFRGYKHIPIRGKHLDKFERKDNLYISVNKFLTILFTFHVSKFVLNAPTILWKISELTFVNTIVSLFAMFLVYDLFYVQFHRVLHLRSIYGYIHKHHHRQKAPSRGYLDATNVHPVEFIIGEYLHLLVIYLIPSHVSTVVVFVILGGILATLNHTRYDIRSVIFNVNVHDVHHRMPESNYGQYTMFWDRIFSTYRAYKDIDN